MVENAAAFVRTGPRPLGLYYAMLQQGAQWQQVARQNPLFGNIFNQVAPLFDLPKEGHLFLQGVERYRSYPWQRHKTEESYTEIVRYGRARLFRCRPEQGPAVLLVPSFINKPYILDLMPGNSLVEHLAEAGFTPYLLDWGDPVTGGISFTLETAITEVLVPMLEAFDKPPLVVGYCMGGLLALGAAALVPEKVQRLAVLAAPWDFSVTPTHHALKFSPWPLEPLFAMSPLIPTDVVQTLFVELDPQGAFQRMASFATLEDETSLQRMAAIEDWLADGWPLEPAIAKTLILDWHRDNQTVRGEWDIAGTKVQPANLTMPTCVVVTEKDKLVPPACSAPLAEQLPNVTRMNVPMGHVGLMAGRSAKQKFYTPLAAWLQQGVA